MLQSPFHGNILFDRNELFISNIKNRKTRYEIYVISNFIQDFSMKIDNLKASIYISKTIKFWNFEISIVWSHIVPTCSPAQDDHFDI